MGGEALQRLREVFDPEAVARAALEDPRGNFAAAWMKGLEIIEADQPSEKLASITYRFSVQYEYLNPTGGLHGGATATMFDIATTWLLFLVAKPGFWEPTMGTTRALNCTYFRPAFEGEVLLLQCEIVNVGKRLASLKGVLKRERDGAVIATCEHDKYNVDADSRI